MKVAFVSQPGEEVVPPVDGSSSITNIAYQIARRLTRSGEGEAIIYAKKGSSQPDAEGDAEGVQFRRVPVEADHWVKPFRLIERAWGAPNAKRPLYASSLYYRNYARRVARDAKAQGCDVVHLLNYSQFAPTIRALHPKAKIVLHMQCAWLTQLDEAMIRERLKAVDLVIGCSDYVTEAVRQRFPEMADRCHTVYNGVDFDAISGRSREAAGDGAATERILYVGRLSPEKGVHVLLEAFTQVAERRPQAELDLIGTPGLLPYEYIIAVDDDPSVTRLARFYGQGPIDKVKTRILQNGAAYLECLHAILPPSMEERVRFRGFVPYTELARFYREADVFLFPSVWDEPFGMPAAEAMACGIPIVVTRGGGLAEVVDDGVTGRAVPRDDAAATAGAIEELLQDPKRRAEMGEAGRERAIRLFSWDGLAEQMLHHYKRLCGTVAA